MIILRKLEEKDFDNKYLELLSQLTNIHDDNDDNDDNIDMIKYKAKLKEILLNKNIEIWIIYDDVIEQIIGTGTIIIEPKLIHGCSNVGHIEDIVIHNDHRNRGIGKMLLNNLVERALTYKCYKVVLFCDEKNVEFYEKCSFTRNGINMSKYFETGTEAAPRGW
jgi:glucosamine-phosphate N-acetyltransferase